MERRGLGVSTVDIGARSDSVQVDEERRCHTSPNSILEATQPSILQISARLLYLV